MRRKTHYLNTRRLILLILTYYMNHEGCKDDDPSPAAVWGRHTGRIIVLGRSFKVLFWRSTFRLGFSPILALRPHNILAGIRHNGHVLPTVCFWANFIHSQIRAQNYHNKSPKKFGKNLISEIACLWLFSSVESTMQLWVLWVYPALREDYSSLNRFACNSVFKLSYNLREVYLCVPIATFLLELLGSTETQVRRLRTKVGMRHPAAADPAETAEKAGQELKAWAWKRREWRLRWGGSGASGEKCRTLKKKNYKIQSYVWF